MKSFCGTLGGVILIFVIIIMVFSWKDDIIAFSKPIDLNVDRPENLKAVETDIDMLLGRFTQEEITTKKDGAITSQKRKNYYVMPILGEETIYYVGIVADSEKSAPYNRISDLSWQYLSGESDQLGEEVINFQGGFVKMDDEVYEHFREWFEDGEFFDDEEELMEYVLPLVLTEVNYEGTRKAAYFTLGAFVLSIILLVYGYRPERRKEAGDVD